MEEDMSYPERVGRREQREMKVKEQGGMADETHLVVWLHINDHFGKCQKEGEWMLLGVIEMCLFCKKDEDEEGDGRGSWQSAWRGLWKGVGKKKSRGAGDWDGKESWVKKTKGEERMVWLGK
ncbi:uncharacterized protein MONOS_17172 [Monocercomonoides exilis]|uniref:uncharacterized protein n=1 Tax=Monocercomonoides exilis TaxID=2049356 RepID=UPI00355A1765|nr:hypothetical protein MONOS_17171 [Monocercomonoides exilis]KAH7829334.1 hypothetical protein MONOS_17172 [Monocercomonoides exilis]